MPAARGVKRTASKTSSAASSAATKNKKKRGVVQLDIPKLPKEKGSVFTCGQGDVGQLGLGEDVIETTKFKKVTALGDKIVDISAGGMHTIALDSSGKVWTYGCNDEGALGRITSGEKDEASPAAVSLPAAAVRVTAGDSHSAALLHDGHVYAWGAFRDSHGSMGLVVREREGKPCKEPVRVDVGEPAADIASGSDHLVILTTSGVVYTMGCGEQGQLGRLSQRSASRDARQGFSALLVPSKVTLKAGASAVWAGYHATFVLDASREKMFAFGLNNYSQLGISGEKRKTALYGPTECDLIPGGNWKQAAAGQHHSLLLANDGLTHAVGRCEYGRLGLGPRTSDAEVLEVIPKLQDKKCVSIAAGTSNSFAVTATGEVFGWGMGSEGQLGAGGTQDAEVPARGALPPGAWRARAVAAGGQHTVLLALDPSQRDAAPAPEPAAQLPADQPGPADHSKRKRQKRDQEEEISSTSGAAAPPPPPDQPQKVNGDENKTSTMEVDESDNVETKKSEENTEQKPDEQKMDTDTEQKDDKPEISDTSSQGTTDSEMKSQEDSQESVAAAEPAKENGVRAEAKAPAVAPSSTELTTTA